jgi:cyanophycinase
MGRKAKGRLVIIGGHEDKVGERTILQEICQEVCDGSLVVVTVASQEPEALAEEYIKVFKELGVKQIEVLDIRERKQAEDEALVEQLKQAEVVFFTGGDQLRITSQIGDSLVFQHMRDLLEAGRTIAGTSAGAAAMSETMLVDGPSDESNRISALSMAPGLGLIAGVVIDSHFAERGRMGRLLGVVAQNPRNLGIGIDEDTAIVVEGQQQFRVIGSGAVYVVDGADISYSSLSEEKAEGVVSIYDVKLHVLGEEDCFDLVSRRPVVPAKTKKNK